MALSTLERERQWNLPNLLTYGRMVAVPVVAGCLFAPDDFRMRWLALAIFAVAGVTDFFDGYLARAWNQQSSLGRMLDPIADKLLVAASLLMLVADQHGDELVDLGRHRDPVPRDPGLGAAGVPGRTARLGAGHARWPSGRRRCSSPPSAS